MVREADFHLSSSTRSCSSPAVEQVGIVLYRSSPGIIDELSPAITALNDAIDRPHQRVNDDYRDQHDNQPGRARGETHFSRLMHFVIEPLLRSLRHVVIFERFRGAELPQRQPDDKDRQQDSDGRRNRILQKRTSSVCRSTTPTGISVPPAFGPYHRRSAVIKQIDDVEIIEVEGVY